MIDIKIAVQPSGLGLELPSYATAGSSGLDLRAAINVDEIVWIAIGSRLLIPTGIALELPVGFEGQIRSRSGIAAEHGVIVLNSPGTIDSDYRQELQVLLANFGAEPFRVLRGDRIAQLVIAQVCRATIHETNQLSASVHRTGGFGSTGVR
jgi:dUTP pyrophosphatase